MNTASNFPGSQPSRILLTGVTVMTALFGASAARATERLPFRDYSSQLLQTSEAILGLAVSPQEGVRFYKGQSRAGKSCFTTVQYGPNYVSVLVKAEGAVGNHEDELTATVPQKSNTLTSLELSLSGGSIGVELQEEYTHADRIDQASYSIRANFDDNANGAARLKSVTVARDEKGKVAQADCGRLLPLLVLSQAEIDLFAETVRDEYARRNPGFPLGGLQGAEVSSCVITRATEVQCDVTFATDYTPDTVHATAAITDGKLGAIQKLEFEPGC